MVAYLPISLQVHIKNLEMEQKQIHFPLNYTSPVQNFKDIPHILQPNINQKNFTIYPYMAVCQNLVPLVNIKIAGKWMFIPLNMVLIGIDP